MVLENNSLSNVYPAMGETDTILGSNTWEAKTTAFKSWCAAQGISITGIDCNEIPNSGLGIMARRRLEVMENLSKLYQYPQ